ncbi:MAG: hypothetical protein A2076_02700 [Geobacteraceae bacterium GWC2_53_11]|nr:MAG: hypothetical protein A2076_02700 [Geobacteraceae bacterium GWC2_53_11]
MPNPYLDTRTILMHTIFSRRLWNDRPWLRYAAAIAIIMAAAAGRILFLGDLGIRAPYMTFYPAVMIVTLFCGLYAGFLATFLCALLASYFWIEPLHQLSIRTPADWLGLLVFMASCSAVASVGALLRRSELRNVEMEARLALYNERKQSEDKLNMALAASRMGVWEWNLSTNAVFWSPECHEIVGLKDFNGSFEAFAELIHPNDAAHAMETVSRSLAQDNAYIDEFRIIRPDGKLCWLQNHGRVTYDADRTPLLMVGTVQDVTDRKQMEEMLKESEERFRSIVENSPNMIMIHADGKYVYLNPAAVKGFGIEDQQEYIGKPIVEAVHPDFRDCVRERLNTIYRYNQSALKSEQQLLRKDGSAFWAEITGIPTVFNGSKSVQVIAVDITARKRSELANERLLLRQRAMLDNLPMMAWLKDRDSRLEMVNEAYAKACGCSVDDCIGKTDLELFPEELARGVMADDHAVCATAVRIQKEELITTPQGTHWYLVYKTPLFDEQGRVLGTMGIAQDISERKQYETELRGYSHRLIEMDENLRKHLAAELHDEIGRDLTALGMNMAVIGNGVAELESVKIGEKIQDTVKLIENISRTVRGIMAGLRPPVLDDFGLLAALRWHGRLFSERTGVVVDVLAEDSFPRLATEKETALFRIAQEALMNAAKHAGVRSVTMTLGICDETVRLVIADQGKGFMHGVFEPSRDGSGWGLKIMRERAETVGGRFQVESDPGGGTAVSVIVPVKEA